MSQHLCGLIVMLCLAFGTVCGLTEVSSEEENPSTTPLITLPKRTAFPDVIDNQAIKKIIEGFGLIYESYNVTTDDGYILNLNRMVLPGLEHKEKGIPILLVNGMNMQSEAWIVQGEPSANIAISWLLSGYDIWLGDQRGTVRSRGHVSLSTEKKEYWEFSCSTCARSPRISMQAADMGMFIMAIQRTLEPTLRIVFVFGGMQGKFHETGIYDLPAFIDFILKKTKYEKLVYTGLSLGSTFFFVMCSERPEYQKKLYGAIQFVPVGFAPVLKNHYATIQKALNTMYYGMSLYRFQNVGTIRDLNVFRNALRNWCEPTKYIWILFLITSLGPGAQYDEEAVCHQLGLVIGGTSTKTILHTLQLFQKGEFRNYDYGLIGNLAKYQRLAPPAYNFSKVVVPVASYYSDVDVFAPAEVVEPMLDKFRGPVYRCKLHRLNHIFIINNLAKNMFDDFVKVLNSMTGRSKHDPFKSGTCPQNISSIG